MTCLDTEEAQAITKQKICECSENLHLYEEDVYCVLAILCSKEHYTSKISSETPQFKETSDEAELNFISDFDEYVTNHNDHLLESMKKNRNKKK